MIRKFKIGDKVEQIRHLYGENSIAIVLGYRDDGYVEHMHLDSNEAKYAEESDFILVKSAKPKLLKVGSTITIKKDLHEGNGNKGCTANEDMLNYRGRKAKITKIDKSDGSFKLSIDRGHWCWTKGMFSEKTTVIKPPKTKFKAGNRVRHEHYGNGTVLKCGERDALVEFDIPRIDFHNGLGKGKKYYCYSFRVSELESTKAKKKVVKIPKFKKDEIVIGISGEDKGLIGIVVRDSEFYVRITHASERTHGGHAIDFKRLKGGKKIFKSEILKRKRGFKNAVKEIQKLPKVYSAILSDNGGEKSIVVATKALFVKVGRVGVLSHEETLGICKFNIYYNGAVIVSRNSNGDKVAPHIFDDGQVCWGNLDIMQDKLQWNGDYAMIASLAIHFLENVWRGGSPKDFYDR